MQIFLGNVRVFVMLLGPKDNSQVLRVIYKLYFTSLKTLHNLPYNAGS